MLHNKKENTVKSENNALLSSLLRFGCVSETHYYNNMICRIDSDRALPFVILEIALFGQGLIKKYLPPACGQGQPNKLLALTSVNDKV
jgi:hypothetical protein